MKIWATKMLHFWTTKTKKNYITNAADALLDPTDFK
jgi:hypothetical protein